MKTDTPVKLTAKVDRVRYPKADAINAPDFNPACFYILACDVGVCKGKLTHAPKSGEAFVFDGHWEISKFNGQPEFIFFHAVPHIPVDPRALLRYACELTPGFGPATEESIWAVRGADWQKLSLEDDIRGLTPARLAAFQKTVEFLSGNQQRAAAVSWLVSIGLTVHMAEVAAEKFGPSVVERVKDNPYILADIPNYGFKSVDEHLRGHFKIDRDSPLRINAAIRYALASLLESDSAVDWAAIFAAVTSYIDSDPQEISNAARNLISNGGLVAFARTERMSTAALFYAESAIMRYAMAEVDIKGAPRARQPKVRDFDLDADQMDAVSFALKRRFSIINGGGGVGKTSVVRAICDSLSGHGSVRLCAFAGKAAARLREATDHPASTIHSMLGWQGEGRGFTLSAFGPDTTVVVDEASMVSSSLLAEIVKRSPARLILVGDEAQLPPVGAGQPFHDIIALHPECVRTLAKCYRSREAILASAIAIRGGTAPAPSSKSESEFYEFTATRSAADSHDRILAAVKSGAVDFDTDIILVCRNGESDTDALTVRALNADIKNIVNPSPDAPAKIAPGDRVMCIKNAAELDVWNGTTGRCRDFDTGGAMWVDLDYPNASGETCVLIPRAKVKEWTLAYALTVHKSQGSQYRRVWVGLTRRDITARLLDRSMLYTAVTRAQNECRVLGDAWAYQSAVGFVPGKHTVMQELSRETKEKDMK